MNKTNKFSPEEREHAVRMVQEHPWGVPVAVGRRGIDRAQVRQRGADAAGLGVNAD